MSDDGLPDGATPPQPERDEPRLPDPRLRDLSFQDWKAVGRRAAKKAGSDAITDVAAALAYYAFLALPAVLLVAVGVFSRTAGPDTITSLVNRLEGGVPDEAITLIEDSLTRVTENKSGGLALIVIGFLLALWTATGAMNALMRGLNRVFGREETRGFAKQRLTALLMLVCLLVAVALVFGLLVLGPVLADRLGGALGLEEAFDWIWWSAEWPILLLGLLVAFVAVYSLGPDAALPHRRFLVPGALVAVAVWLVASGGFAFYVSKFASYNKAWGSLGGVIVMLTWIWLSALALLFGGEIGSETERSRELRSGEPAEVELQVAAKG